MRGYVKAIAIAVDFLIMIPPTFTSLAILIDNRKKDRSIFIMEGNFLNHFYEESQYRFRAYDGVELISYDHCFAVGRGIVPFPKSWLQV